MKITKKSVGFTLIEIMVAVAILGILLAGIYGLYTSIYNSYLSQNQLSDVEQNARIGLEQMMKEIRMVGYNAQGSQVYKTTAVDFVFQEEVRPVIGTGPVVNKKIEYFFDSANKKLLRGEEALTSLVFPNYPSDNTPIINAPLMAMSKIETVASNISALSFTYYDASNAAFSPTSTSNFTNITRVRIVLTAQSNSPSPDKIGVVGTDGKIHKQVQVEADIRLRNMGIGQANAGTIAPAAPTGLAVYDTGNPCGSLNVQWAANTEPSLAGYTLYYRISGTTVPYTQVPLGKVTSSILTGLTIGTTYAVTIKAYDNVGNYSNYGTVIISANTTVGGPPPGGIVDTQPNVTPPAAPTSITASAGDKLVTLNWTASTTTGIPGYNIYRMAWNGTAYPPISSAVLLNTTPVNATTFSDTFPDIPAPNCPLTYQNQHGYQYQVAAVDCSGSGGIGPYSSPISGTSGTSNTYPKDTVAPADPANFVATAGANEAYLKWDVPSDPDIFGVRIYSNNGNPMDLSFSTYPTSSSFMRNPYNDSTVVTSGTKTFRDTPLSNSTVYTYKIYAFDKCNNTSPGASTASATICGDASYGGPPDNPTNFIGSWNGTIGLSWSFPTKNGGDAVANIVGGIDYRNKPFAPMPGDVVGFNVYRCTEASFLAQANTCTKSNGAKLNKSLDTTNSFIGDGDNPPVIAVVPGQTYYYAVTAVDCALNESLTYATAPDGTTRYVKLTPGGLAQDVYFLFGTSTGLNSSTTFNDTAQSFAAWPAYQNATLRITQGTDVGERRPIVGNTGTSLTIPTFYQWSSPLPDTTSKYEIDRPITASGSAFSQNRDKIMFYVKNTSAGAIQIRNSDTANISWKNYGTQSQKDYKGATANLKMIKVNGTTLWSSLWGVSSGTNVTFTSLATPLSLTGLQNGIPMELYFVAINGDPSDMQGETIDIVMTYGNPNPDSTYTTCTWSTLATPASPVTVPLVPVGFVEQHQNTADLYTLGSNTAGSNIFQAGTGPVSFWNWFLSPTWGNYVTSATVYYCQQSWSVITTTPPLPTALCYSASPPLSMTINLRFDTLAYATGLTPNITESGSPFRIWYYVQITDNMGNIYNVPDSYLYNGTTGFNAYTYDQYDKFNPSFTMSWSSNGTNRNIVVTGSVTDVSGTAGNSPGATVTLTYTGGVGNTATVTQILVAGANTWTSPNIFGNSENATVTLTLSKSGFGPNAINVCGAYPGGPGAVPLASTVANNTQVPLCP